MSMSLILGKSLLSLGRTKNTVAHYCILRFALSFVFLAILPLISVLFCPQPQAKKQYIIYVYVMEINQHHIPLPL